MSVSTAPAVLDALVAGLTTAVPDVQVTDGQPIVTADDVICVGFGGEGEPAVESTRTREQLTLEPDRESYDITCLASSWTGATAVRPVRARAYELLEAVAAYLLANPRVGGVLSARLSAERLIQEQTENGAAATVQFTVHVDAFVPRT